MEPKEIRTQSKPQPTGKITRNSLQPSERKVINKPNTNAARTKKVTSTNLSASETVKRQSNEIIVISDDESEIVTIPACSSRPRDIKINSVKKRKISSSLAPVSLQRTHYSPPPDPLQMNLSLSKSHKNQDSDETNQGNSRNIPCGICLNPATRLTSTHCGHVYCEDCINQALILLERCPTCRRPLTLDQIHRIFVS